MIKKHCRTKPLHCQLCPGLQIVTFWSEPIKCVSPSWVPAPSRISSGHSSLSGKVLVWQLTSHRSSLYFWTPWICHMEAKSRILTLPRNRGGGGFSQLLCPCLSVSLTSVHMRPGRCATQHECASLPARCDSPPAGRCSKHFRPPFVNHPPVPLGWCCLCIVPPWIESQMFGLWNGLKNKSKIIINNRKQKSTLFYVYFAIRRMTNLGNCE